MKFGRMTNIIKSLKKQTAFGRDRSVEEMLILE